LSTSLGEIIAQLKLFGGVAAADGLNQGISVIA
jgi:hypothetical protein